MYALDGKPKTMEEAVDRLQFFQHSKQGRPPGPMCDVVKVVAPEEAPPGRSGNPEPHKGIGESPEGTAACAVLIRLEVLHPPPHRGPRQRGGFPRLLQMRRSG